MPETNKRKERQRERAEIIIFEQLFLLDKCSLCEKKKQNLSETILRYVLFEKTLIILLCNITTAAPFNVQFVESFHY